MNLEILNPTESRRDFLKKTPARIGALAAISAIPLVLAGCDNSPRLESGIARDVDSLLSEYEIAKRSGQEGSRGVLAAQYGLETGDSEPIIDYVDRFSHKGFGGNYTNPFVLAYAGIQEGIDSYDTLEAFDGIHRIFEGEGIAADLTATSLVTDKNPEEIKDLYDQVADFSGLKSLGLIDSTDAVEVITQVAAFEDIETARAIYEDVDSRYNGDNNLTEGTLTLAAYISGDVEGTMDKIDKVNATDFGFMHTLQEENKALMVLAASTGAYTIEEVIQMYKYIESKTGFGNADRARLVLALSSIKSGIGIVSRKFERVVSAGKTTRTEEMSVPILISK